MRKFLLLRHGGNPHVQWPPSKWSPKVMLIAFFIMTGFLFSFSASAQNKIKVTGNVVDTTGQVLTGVAVRVQGTQGGTTTDAQGNFSINVPGANSTLVFTYIGFTSLELP